MTNTDTQRLLDACIEAEPVLADMDRILRERHAAFTGLPALTTVREAITSTERDGHITDYYTDRNRGGWASRPDQNPLAWAVMKDGAVLSVRRFKPRATSEQDGVEFVPLCPAPQPATAESARLDIADAIKAACSNGHLPDRWEDVADRIALAQPAQPEQEPVAWADPNDLERKGSHDLYVATERVDGYTLPLYTSQQPPAQPLTYCQECMRPNPVDGTACAHGIKEQS
jgi:hypothetical protein